MTYRTDTTYAVEDEAYDDDEEPRRGLLSWILIVAVLMGTGGGSALIWRTFGGGQILAAMASTRVAVAETPSPGQGQGDLIALRQEITGSVQSTQQLLTAQQAEIKRLVEQVSALSNKLELMQRPVASAQAAIPVPAPKAVAPAPKQRPAEAAKPAAAKPVQPKPIEARPADNKPANGAISTGGAPLPPIR